MGSLVLDCVVGLGYQLVEIKEFLVELEIHSLQLRQVEQIIYQCYQHARLERNVLQEGLNLNQLTLLLLKPLLCLFKLLLISVYLFILHLELLIGILLSLIHLTYPLLKTLLNLFDFDTFKICLHSKLSGRDQTASVCCCVFFMDTRIVCLGVCVHLFDRVIVSKFRNYEVSVVSFNFE